MYAIRSYYANSDEALREVAADIEEGADIVMVNVITSYSIHYTKLYEGRILFKLYFSIRENNR